MDIAKSYGMDSSWIDLAHTVASLSNARSYSFTPANLKDIPAPLGDLLTTALTKISRNAEKAYDQLIPALYPVSAQEKPIWSYRELRKIDVDYLAKRVVDSYQFTGEEFEAVIIGPSNGGLSLAACALGIPYLPTQLTLHVFCPLPKDPAIEDLLKKWPAKVSGFSARGSEVILHYDPIHDKEAVQNAVFMRTRFKELPPSYQSFIQKHLKKSGKLIFIDCTSPQIQTRIEEDMWLQIGSYSEIDYRKILDCDGYKFESRPDAEGGSCPELKHSIAEYCQRNDIELVHGQTSDPVGYSIMNAAASRHKGNKLVMGSYTMYPPLSAQSEWASIWLPFVDRRSYEAAQRSLKILDKDLEKIIFGCDLGIGPDIVRHGEWRNMFSEHSENVSILGTLEDKDSLSISYCKESSKFTEETYRLFSGAKRQTTSMETFLQACEELGMLS